LTRVLIADDHPIMLSGIRSILDGSEFQVVATATNGAAALEEIARTAPDILLLDLRMPELDGMDVLRTLRNRGDRRAVILLTAELEDDNLVEAIQLGVEGILLKDGAQNLLLNCLGKVASGGRWIDKSLLERALEATMRDSRAQPSPSETLTQREKAIVSLVARGLRNKEVASELDLTEGTVKVYLYRIYEKLGVTNRTELALYARDYLPEGK
jgi:two-component system nitrate/nitrite response regulator NarP